MEEQGVDAEGKALLWAQMHGVVSCCQAWAAEAEDGLQRKRKAEREAQVLMEARILAD